MKTLTVVALWLIVGVLIWLPVASFQVPVTGKPATGNRLTIYQKIISN